MADDIFAEERALEEARKKAAVGSAAGNIFSDLPQAGFSPRVPDPSPVYHGGMLPFSRDSTGKVYFDPLNAGPIGSMKEAFKTPREVYTGERPMPRTFDPSVLTREQTSPIMGSVLNLAGAFGTGVNPMVRSGDRMIPGIRMAPKDMRRATTPSGEELRTRGGEQLDAFRDMPIKYDPSYFGTLANQMEQALLQKGVFRINSPELYGTLDQLRKNVPPPGTPGGVMHADPANLMAMRENIAGLFDKPSEHQKGVGIVHGIFNDFLENPPAQAVLAGPAEFGAQIYREGRGNYAAGMRDKDLEEIQRASRLRTRSANSGQNIDNTVRSRVTSAILNANKIKGYNPDEVAMLEGVPEGDTARNIARVTGNLLGGGGGLGATVAAGLGTTAGHFAGLGDLSWVFGPAVPAVGAAIKKWGGRGTVEALEDARNVIRQRSPVFQQTPRSIAAQDIVPDFAYNRDAFGRQLQRMEGTTEGVPVMPEEPDAQNMQPNAGPRRVYIDQPSRVVLPDGTIEDRS